MNVGGPNSKLTAILCNFMLTIQVIGATALRDEVNSLPALARLLDEIRGSVGQSDQVHTRSKAKKRKNGSTSSAISPSFTSNPLFRQTPLQELYLGDMKNQDNLHTTIMPAMDAEIAQNMVWEQLELRIDKVLDIYREIIKDGELSNDLDDDDVDSEMYGIDDEDDENEEDILDEDDLDDAIDLDEGDSQASEEDTSSEPEDQEDEGEDELDDQHAESPQPKPYFAKLREGSSSGHQIDDLPALDMSDDETEQQEGAEAENSVESFARPSSSRKRKSKTSSIVTTAGSTSVDAGFFSLADFHSQTRDGEDEMRRYMHSGKSKSAADLQNRLDNLDSLSNAGGIDEDENDENAEIDYFAPVGRDADTDASENSNEEEEEGNQRESGLNVVDVKYDDFWNPPKLLYGDSPSVIKKGKDRESKAKLSQKTATRPTTTDPKKSSVELPESKSAPSSSQQQSLMADKLKRRVSFHDNVKVQEFDSPGSGKSAIAALVKKVGMSEALKRINKGEIEDEDLDGLDQESDFRKEGQMDGVNEDEDDENEYDDDEEEEEGEEAESIASEQMSDAAAQTMRRIHNDLLMDDASASTSSNTSKSKMDDQSRYQQRLSALSEQIGVLEQENVAEREWAMRGEANARARPLNSLLEEDLEFDQVAKVVPVVTEESSLSLEEKIKKRILDVSLSL